MKKVRMGFIGVGGRGKGQVGRVVADFGERAEVTALADVNEQNLKLTRELAPGAGTYADYRELLARDDVDAVCISTPQFTHHEITVAAFDAGKHVYCEKPLALSVNQCTEMMEAGKKAGKVFIVGQQMRYHLHLNRMKRLIEDGTLGTPYLAWLKEFRNPFPEHMAWTFDKTKSGGAIVEKSCHHFDVFNWMLGTPPVKVFASGSQAVHKEIFGIKSDIVDNCWVVVEHEGGKRSMLGLCFFAGLPHAKEAGVGTHVRDIGVIGDKGMVVTEGFNLGRNLEIRFSDRGDVVRYNLNAAAGSRSDPFAREGNFGIWLDFFNCIETGETPSAPAEIGRDALAVALAAEESIVTCRPVNISDVE